MTNYNAKEAQSRTKTLSAIKITFGNLDRDDDKLYNRFNVVLLCLFVYVYGCTFDLQKMKRYQYYSACNNFEFQTQSH